MVRIQALVNGLDRLFPLILRAFDARRRIYLHSDRKRQRGMRFFGVTCHAETAYRRQRQYIKALGSTARYRPL